MKFSLQLNTFSQKYLFSLINKHTLIASVFKYKISTIYCLIVFGNEEIFFTRLIMALT